MLNRIILWVCTSLIIPFGNAQTLQQKDTPALLMEDIITVKRDLRSATTSSRNRIAQFLDSLYIGHLNQVQELNKTSKCAQCYEMVRVKWVYNGKFHGSLKIDIQAFTGKDEPVEYADYALFDLTSGQECYLYDLISQNKKEDLLVRLNQKLEEARIKLKSCKPLQEDPLPEKIYEEQLMQLRLDQKGIFVHDIYIAPSHSQCNPEIRLDFNEAKAYFNPAVFIIY